MQAVRKCLNRKNKMKQGPEWVADQGRPLMRNTYDYTVLETNCSPSYFFFLIVTIIIIIIIIIIITIIIILVVVVVVVVVIILFTYFSHCL